LHIVFSSKVRRQICHCVTATNSGFRHQRWKGHTYQLRLPLYFILSPVPSEPQAPSDPMLPQRSPSTLPLRLSSFVNFPFETRFVLHVVVSKGSTNHAGKGELHAHNTSEETITNTIEYSDMLVIPCECLSKLHHKVS
jgi:hypothetical protein